MGTDLRGCAWDQGDVIPDVTAVMDAARWCSLDRAGSCSCQAQRQLTATGTAFGASGSDGGQESATAAGPVPAAVSSQLLLLVEPQLDDLREVIIGHVED